MSKKRVAKIEKRISAMTLMHKKHMKREKILYSRIDAEIERAIRADFMLHDRLDNLERKLKELEDG